MADRRVKYILEVDYEGESVTARAADDLREVDDAAKQASDGLEQASGGFSKVQASIVTMQSALGIAQQGFEAIQQAAQFAYETLSEGAALADARGDFEDLAASIGTTADVMESELATAAGGLVTNAQLIGQAGELMALGLGLSKDEIVQLTGLAAELDWNFQTLTDTLNTGSTRGLKELGLSIAEVRSRAEELEAAGMAVDEAFRWAIIETADDKVDLVGRKSQEAAGQLQQLETIAGNVQDVFARGSAEGFADALGAIAGSAPAAGAGLELAAAGAGNFVGELAGYALINQFSDDLAYFIQQGRELEEQAKKEAAAREEVGRAYQWVIDQYMLYGAAQEEASIGTERQIAQGEMAIVRAAEYAEQLEWTARAAEWVGDAQERAAAADYARARAVEELAARQELAAAAAETWAAYTQEVTATGGDYFTQFSEGADSTWDLGEAIYNAADAAGAGIGPLGDLAKEYKGLSQDAVDAATSQAQQQIVIDNIAQAARDGKIAWEDYRQTVEDALDLLENGFPDPVVRENPNAQQLADMHGIDPAEVPGVVDLPANTELQLSVNYDAVLDAVTEARGIVDGFVSPVEAYEAVMTMDISDVETKVGTVRGLIDEIPEVKNVRINVTTTGIELVEQLRALGALP